MKLVQLINTDGKVQYVNPESVMFLREHGIYTEIILTAGATVVNGSVYQVARLLCPTLELDEQAAKNFVQALLKPRKPDARLKRAMTKHKKLISRT